MPLTLPNTFTTTLDVSKFNDNFYDSTNGGTSFEIINGRLDDSYMDATGWPEVIAEQTQRGTFVFSGSVAGTVNLDYFDEWFRDVESGNVYTTHDEMYLAIPGGAATFYVPFENARVVFRWQVAWTNDSTNQDNHSEIRLFVDGTAVADAAGTVRKTCQDTAGHAGRLKARYWCGHYVSLLGRGWHSAGLRIVADEDINQTRIWTRGFRWVGFKV